MALKHNERAFELLQEMNARGILPRADTFNTIITGLTKVRVFFYCRVLMRITSMCGGVCRGYYTPALADAIQSFLHHSHLKVSSTIYRKFPGV